jgi:hypothetical protein
MTPQELTSFETDAMFTSVRSVIAFLALTFERPYPRARITRPFSTTATATPGVEFLANDEGISVSRVEISAGWT